MEPIPIPDASVSVQRPSIKPHVVVIGAGLGGLATAGLLAKKGYDVTVVEKNEQCGGHAGVIREKGFTFCTSPSWYLQPEVFEQWFADLGRNASDYYTLKRLDPSYRIFFSPNDIVDIVADLKTNLATFESIEPGSAERFTTYLAEAHYKYDAALKNFLYKEYRTVFSLISWHAFNEGLRLTLFTSLDSYVGRFFKDDKLRKILEYPLMFLGGSPKSTPAIYSALAHADYTLGVWYPRGGLNAVAVAMEHVCKELGVRFRYNSPVRRIIVEHDRAAGVETSKGIVTADAVVSDADYVHTELSLLESKHRTYPSSYWDSKVIAPSAFILYLGVKKRLTKLKHHNLFFASDWHAHFDQIFKKPEWPEKPSYYVCAPSKSDPNQAPKGCENLFVLVPVASGLDEDEHSREEYADKIISHLEAVAGESFADAIVVKKIFSQGDFVERYNAFKGTALGLAQTRAQTLWRPASVSKKVPGLFYTGRYTRPGIGVSMCVISGTMAAYYVDRELHGQPRR